MKKFLLFLTCVLTLFGVSKAATPDPVTISFDVTTTIPGLSTSSNTKSESWTFGGYSFASYGCYKNSNKYVMVGKNGYLQLPTFPNKVASISITGGVSQPSTNAVLTLYEGSSTGTQIGQPYTQTAGGSNTYEVNGTQTNVSYFLKTNNYNFQLQTVTINFVDEENGEDNGDGEDDNTDIGEITCTDSNGNTIENGGTATITLGTSFTFTAANAVSYDLGADNDDDSNVTLSNGSYIWTPSETCEDNYVYVTATDSKGESSEFEFTVTVTDSQGGDIGTVPTTGSSFQLVTNASDIVDGGYYVLAYDYNNSPYSINPPSGNGNLISGTITKVGNKVTTLDGNLIFKLEKTGNQWLWIVINEGTNQGKALSYGSDGTATTLAATNQTNTKTTVTFQDDDNTVKIEFGATNRALMGYQGKEFRAYTSANYNNGVWPSLYKYVVTDPSLIDPELSFSETEATAYIGEAFSAPSLTNKYGLTVSYESSDPTVATVNTEGEVTALKVGTTKISATTTADQTYSAGYAEYTLTVVDPNITVTKYTLVTDVNSLSDYAECVIAYTTGNVAMGAQSGSYRDKVSATISNNELEYADGMAIVSISKTDQSDNNGNPYYTLGVTGGYLSAATSGNNLNTAASLSDACYATISIDNSGNATITFNSSNSSNQIRYNASSPRFSCYGGTQQAVQLYMNPNSVKGDPVPSLSFTFNGETVTEPVELDWNATEFPTLVLPEGITSATYTSSDTNVAEINASTGEITLKSVKGETTITATTEAVEGQWKAGSASYTLVVLDPNSQTATFDFTTKDPYGMTSTNDNNTYYYDEISFSENRVTMKVTGKYRSWGSSSYDFRIYTDNNSAIEIGAPVGYMLETIKFSGNKLNNLTTETGTYNNGVWESKANEVDTYVVFTPTAAPNIETITVWYTLDPYFYLMGTMTDNKTANPSYRFSNNGDGVYTLEVATINAYNGGKAQFVIANGNASVVYTGPSSADQDMKAGETYSDLKQWANDAVDYYMGLASTLYNVTLTLNTKENTLSIEGTPGSSNQLEVTVGNDKTMQSGSVGSNEIKLQTQGESAMVYVFAPNGVQVYYAIELSNTTDQKSVKAKAGENLTYEAAQKSEYEKGAYNITLETGTSGTLYLKYGESLENASEPVAYTYIVTRAIPTGIDGIGAEDGEAEYYTLQGVKVQNPERGIYIKVEGGKASKIVK